MLPWGTLGAYRALLAGPPMTDSVLAPLMQAGDSASMLIRTLETYLDLGGDAKKTAAQLHLHRTSLYYRLGRIAETLQTDLGDGLTRLELHLALKSREQPAEPSDQARPTTFCDRPPDRSEVAVCR